MMKYGLARVLPAPDFVTEGCKRHRGDSETVGGELRGESEEKGMLSLLTWVLFAGAIPWPVRIPQCEVAPVPMSDRRIWSLGRSPGIVFFMYVHTKKYG